MPRWFIAALATLVAFPMAAIGLALWSHPALATALCPTCSGMQQSASGPIVDPDMPADQRATALRNTVEARSLVEAALGPIETAPTFVMCSTRQCDRAQGGRGARAQTLSTPFGTVIRLGPNGLDRTIIAHELAHVRIHELIGLWRQITGGVPAWFDEGIATIVSEDERYSSAACADGPELPVSPFDWADASGRDPNLYARAACAVRSWLEAEGGMSALRIALGDGRPLP